MDSLAAVLAQLKDGRYWAAADYVSTAKSMHLREHEWSSMLARQHAVCLRSALRGLGPKKQCDEFELHDLTMAARLLKDEDKMPLGLHRTSVVGFFFYVEGDRAQPHAVHISGGG